MSLWGTSPFFEMSQKNSHGKRINYRKLAELSSLGLMLPSSIAVGMFMGWLLDRFLHTHPWMLGIFTILGTVSGFISLIRGLKKIGIEKDD